MSDENLPTILNELSEIQGMMGNTSSAYWKGSNAGDLQSRYSELLSKKQAIATPTMLDASEEAPVAIYGVKDYIAEHGTADGYDNYRKVASHAADIVTNLSVAERSAVTRSFAALPDETAIEMMRELMRSKPSVSWVSEGMAKKFKSSDAGLILSEEWGGDTRKNLAIVRERVFRIGDNISEQAGAVMVRFLDGLSTAAFCAVCRKLAA